MKKKKTSYNMRKKINRALTNWFAYRKGTPFHHVLNCTSYYGNTLTPQILVGHYQKSKPYSSGLSMIVETL